MCSATSAQIQTDGAILIHPEEGDLASGDVGVGRLADPSVIVEAVDLGARRRRT